jgi:hypothetical protein
MLTAVPKYYSGLGWAIHGKEAEMTYAVTDGSYGASGASSCLIWIDPAYSLSAFISRTISGVGPFNDGNGESGIERLSILMSDGIKVCFAEAIPALHILNGR